MMPATPVEVPLAHVPVAVPLALTVPVFSVASLDWQEANLPVKV